MKNALLRDNCFDLYKKKKKRNGYLMQMLCCYCIAYIYSKKTHIKIEKFNNYDYRVLLHMNVIAA